MDGAANGIKPWRSYLFPVISLMLGVFLGRFIIGYISRLNSHGLFYGTLALYLLFILLLYGANYIQIAIHEAGPLLFGLLAGFRFGSYRIGSFIWIKKEGKIRFGRYTLHGSGGQCLMYLPEEGNVRKKGLVLYHMGGSILNALAGSLFFLLFLCFRKIPYAGPVFLLLGLFGIFHALLNGIPMETDTINNDGHNTRSILRDPRGAEAFCLQHRITEQSVKGVPLKDMPPHWFTVPEDEAMKNSMVATLAVSASNRLMEELQFDEADELIDHILSIQSGLVGIHRILLTCDRIYMELMRENRADQIQGFLSSKQKKYMKAMGKNLSVLRTEYALALLSERNTAKGQSIKAQFEAVAKTHPYQGDVSQERSFMELTDQRVYAIMFEGGFKDVL